MTTSCNHSTVVLLTLFCAAIVGKGDGPAQKRKDKKRHSYKVPFRAEELSGAWETVELECDNDVYRLDLAFNRLAIDIRHLSPEEAEERQFEDGYAPGQFKVTAFAVSVNGGTRTALWDTTLDRRENDSSRTVWESFRVEIVSLRNDRMSISGEGMKAVLRRKAKEDKAPTSISCDSKQ